MTDDEAEALAAKLNPGARNGWARRLSSGKCCVGSGDDEFRYLLGQGSTWEEAFEEMRLWMEEGKTRRSR